MEGQDACRTSPLRLKDAYSRINAIVIEGEQEAHDNYIPLGTRFPTRLRSSQSLRAWK